MTSFKFIRLLATATLAATTFFSPLSHAQAAGQKYTVVSPSQPSNTPGKIEVLEFFAYTCPHCAAIQPIVENWLKTAPQDVAFSSVPIAFNASMKPLQQLYYTLAALNRLDLHPKVFTAIYGQRLRLDNKKAMTDWAVAQGVDRAKFEATFDSFGVNASVERANQLAKTYRIDGTPSFAVGGKFLTSPAIADGYEGAIAEVSRLIPMARGSN